MAHYSYKDVAYRGDFNDAIKDWEAKAGRTYEGTADYDGDIYEVAGFLLDKKDTCIAALQARVRELEEIISEMMERERLCERCDQELKGTP